MAIYKTAMPTKVGDRVIVFSGKINGECGEIVSVIPPNMGVLTRFRVLLDGESFVFCSSTEIYVSKPVNKTTNPEHEAEDR
jgi:hypothetical protein